jgi:hypothetical protein
MEMGSQYKLRVIPLFTNPVDPVEAIDRLFSYLENESQIIGCPFSPGWALLSQEGPTHETPSVQ